VDFDPVQAKAEGRDTGLPNRISDLFPASFEDSELGAIPRGWRIARLGELLELKRGYDLPSGHRRLGKVPIVSSSGPSGAHDQSKARAPGIVTGRYGTIGKVFFMWEDFWPLNTTLYVRTFKASNPFYAYYLLQLFDFHKFSDKAAVPGINRNHLHEQLLVAPPRTITEDFGSLAGTWLDRQSKNCRQCDTLTELRDTLLPKLISGELRVKDAGRFVLEAA
jgi:type I restriction enzyme, S subunit